jgi:hypothetical protein
MKAGVACLISKLIMPYGEHSAGIRLERKRDACMLAAQVFRREHQILRDAS